MYVCIYILYIYICTTAVFDPYKDYIHILTFSILTDNIHIWITRVLWYGLYTSKRIRVPPGKHFCSFHSKRALKMRTCLVSILTRTDWYIITPRFQR